MSGKGELVEYTRLVEEAPLTPHKKERLKEKILDIIDAASTTITIEVMTEASIERLQEEERKKRR
jgi:hypothetical protein